MQQVSLFDLNEYIKRVIALNFQEPLWVQCEISQANEVRGQVYLDLVQVDEESNQVVAQANAAIWYKSYLFIKNKLKGLLPSLLQSGTKVLLKVKVEYSERYGMKLIVEDIDPSYTIGQMEMKKQKILQQLKEAGVTESNKSLSLPRVIQSVAVISSPTAAGYKDFIAQLTNNEYAYAIQTTLYAAAMQGQNTDREVSQALMDIKESKTDYDVIVIIRGGGSKLDLSFFDSYNIGHGVATHPLPVLTGIGHEIDDCVADAVAYQAFKTPTAVASYIVDHNLVFESEVHEMSRQIGQLATYQLGQHKTDIDHTVQQISFLAKANLEEKRMILQQKEVNLSLYARLALDKTANWLAQAEMILDMNDPKYILSKGYAMITKDDNNVVSAKSLKKGDAITLHLKDGKKGAVVE